MLQATNLSVRRGVKLLFENTNFQIYPGQKVGLTGANGTGKSSLFSLIQNDLHSDVGDCIYPDHWTIAHVAQEIPDEGFDCTVCRQTIWAVDIDHLDSRVD